MPDELRAQLFGYLPLYVAMLVALTAFFGWFSYRSIRFLKAVPDHPLKAKLLSDARQGWYVMPILLGLMIVVVHLWILGLSAIFSAIFVGQSFLVVSLVLLQSRRPDFFEGMSAFARRPRLRPGEPPDWDAWFVDVQGRLDRMRARNWKARWLLPAVALLTVSAATYTYWHFDRAFAPMLRMRAFEQQMTRRLSPWAEEAFIAENRAHRQVLAVIVRPAYQTRPQEVLLATQKALARQHARRAWHIVIKPRNGKRLLSGDYQPEGSHA
jgi:hypothetical protein